MICVGCKNPSLILYTKKSRMNLPIYLCKVCNLYISGNSEMEISSTVKSEYNSPLKENLKKIIDSDFNTSRGEYIKNHWKSQYRWCEPYYNKMKDFLEIGAGAGWALRMFEKHGFNVTGIDLNKNCVEFINKKLKNGKCVYGFWEDLDFEQKFDIIWVNHVYEHVISPDLFLKKCHQYLHDNGFIFIAVPNCENPKILKDSINENTSTFHYSRKALEKIVSNAGFRIVKFAYMRELYKFEGGFHRRLEKYANFINQKICSYYPFKNARSKNGIEMRLLLKKL